jgi:hypothetical protein
VKRKMERKNIKTIDIDSYCVKLTMSNISKFDITFYLESENGETYDIFDPEMSETQELFSQYDYLELCKNGSLYGYIGNTSYDIFIGETAYPDKEWKKIINEAKEFQK